MSVIEPPCTGTDDPLGGEFIPAPLAPPRDQLSGHKYDGIQEYDNPTPGWWTAIFVVSVFFSFFYFVFYHGGVPERSVYDSYGESVSADAKKTLARLGISELTVTQENMLQWMANKDYVEYGKSVFKANCVSCHGANGEGKVGPNLTDGYYKNITKLTDIARVVNNGAGNGAMQSWSHLGNVDTSLVAAYVATLRGQNLPGPPNTTLGNVIDPWPALPASTVPAR
jgi:cytochrome c oxidase cbb3-type subunit III